MNRICFVGIILFFSLFQACSHTGKLRNHLEMDQEKIVKFQSILGSLKNSIAKYSLNVHTQEGTTQTRITEIDSLSLINNKLVVYEKSGLMKFPLNEIDSLSFSSIFIPNRPAGALSGSNLFNSIENLTFSERELIIRDELLKGNIPDFLRNMCRIKSLQSDSLGIMHEVVLEVMSDYLAIGSNKDYVRIPMGPQTAQYIADAFNCLLPTRKIVNIINQNSAVKIEPVTYYPVGNTNELVSTFYKHNKEIEARLASAGAITGYIMAGGLKKDVIITNLLTAKPGKVAIYGWHKPDGNPIQPLYTGHVNWYVDYSHGIRLVNSVIWVDGKETTIQKLLSDPVLYKLLSDEAGVMLQPRYLY